MVGTKLAQWGSPSLTHDHLGFLSETELSLEAGDLIGHLGSGEGRPGTATDPQLCKDPAGANSADN